MQVPLEIAARSVELSSTDETVISDRVRKLEGIHARLMSCRVAVEMPHRHRRTGVVYGVRIDLTVPGGELVVDRKTGDTLLSAIQRAFNAAERQLRRHVQRQRGDVKQHDEPQSVARVHELYPLGQYGFLETADGDRVYFDARSVVDGGFGRLSIGSSVRYVTVEGDKGPQASTVIPIK
jgi:ribosome-associated translation inhibitor RaiA